VADVIAIADALGLPRFHLVVHDHGCVVGWCCAARHPERVASYVPMSVPHPAAFAQALQSDAEQIKASQYFHTFAAVQGKSLEKFAAGITDTIYAAPGFTAEMISEYKALFSQPTALRAALNWYNGAMEAQLLPCPPVLPGSPYEGNAEFAAMVKNWVGSKREGIVKPPVRHLWGKTDNALRRVAVEASVQFCSGGYSLVVIDCGHWMLQEAGSQCVAEILSHVRGHKISTSSL